MCWGKGANPIDLYNSLNRLKNVVENENLIFPGHSYGKKPGVSFGYILKNNLYIDIQDVDKFVNIRMRKNQNSLFKFQ